MKTNPTPYVLKLELILSAEERKYSVEEAIELMDKIYAAMESVEDFRLKLKWCLGHIVTHLKAPPHRRMETIQDLSRRLWEDRKIRANQTVLYECASLVRSFDEDLAKFEAWIRDTKAMLSRPIYWSDVQRLILGGRSNPRVIGTEAADQRDMRLIEEATGAIDRLLERDGDSDRSEQVAGVLEAYRQSVEALLRSSGKPVHTPRSDRYLAFVRRHGCVVCERGADAHHAFGRRGRDSKPSDFACVPLCRQHHAIWHQIGPSRFEDKYDVNLVEIAFNLLHRYVTGTWVTTMLNEA